VRRARTNFGAALFGLVCAGCVGEIGDGGAADGRPDLPVDADSLAFSSQRRLTRAEIERTLRDLVGDAAVDAAALELAGLPSDEVKDGFTTMAGNVSAAYVEGSFRLADAVAEAVAHDPAARAALEPCLGDASPDQACVRSFAARFGRRAWRRPLTEAEITDLIASYDSGATLTSEDGVALALLHLLSAPPFLYRLELEGAETNEPGIFALTSFELATRLAYAVWGTTPDEVLLDAAASGALDTEDGFAAEIQRMAADPRAKEHAATFFREWLQLDKVATPQQSAGFLAGIDGASLPALASAELEDFLVGQAFVEGGGISDLFAGRGTSVMSGPLAEVYGVEGGAGTLPPERAGAVGRVAMLIDTGETTHPIRRGARVRRRILCDDIQLPAPTEVPPDQIKPPPFDASKTARERWTDQTSGATCASCHARINAIGFALEGFDTLGRVRQTEPIVDATGTVVNELPIDATVEVDLGDGAPVVVDGAAGLAQALAESEAVRRCFARQWLRFSAGRRDGADDAPIVEALREADDTGGLRELFTSAPLHPTFRYHRQAP
jgi:hypothetical protein